jgi:hypothetical protein
MDSALTKDLEAFIVHGEVDQAEAFAQRLLNAGAARATVPAYQTEFFIGAQPAESKGPSETLAESDQD